jgi:hypothetical protein
LGLFYFVLCLLAKAGYTSYMIGKKPNKRIYLINRDFQIKYVKLSVVVGFGSTVLTIFLLLFPLHYFGVIRFPGFLPTPFVWGIGLAAVANFFLVGVGTILITHRIAGPMFSLVRQMRMIQSNYWDCNMTVRQSDDMQFVIRNFNDLVDSLKMSVADDLEQFDNTISAIDAGKDSSEIKDIILAHRNIIKNRLTKEAAND